MVSLKQSDADDEIFPKMCPDMWRSKRTEWKKKDFSLWIECLIHIVINDLSE